MPRIDLPKDNWAELRDPDEVSEARRRPILAAVNRISQQGWDTVQALNPEEVAEATSDGDVAPTTEAKVKTLSADDLAAFQEANDWCIVALVKGWSYSQPITLEGALDLPGAAYDRLRDVCAPAIRTLFVSFEPEMGADGNVDPNSPFGPSSGSSGLSLVEPPIPEVPSPSSGEPISSSNSG